ncbi:hypothetical protein SAMN05428959_11210 [Duganella sp. CF517]|uniref:hypothetical protein n=1 Tax=Duganella sp. CF517 TaxID=1881038 RepID=UPI0008CBCD97|nr:hypothetical protein [Duganella sp. CF517]SEO61095.1 hypothetical protein SAMN05428959_11210 [Duganella sp. CF517]
MRILISMLAVCALAACVNTPLGKSTPQWDRQFGGATRTALAQQIIDPAPRRGDGAVAGMDGKAAQGAYERYQRTFSGTAPPAPTFMISSDSK